MNKILLSVLLAACAATAVAQTNVVPLEKGSAVPQNHVVYFLPRTEIVVSVEQQTFPFAQRCGDKRHQFLPYSEDRYS